MNKDAFLAEFLTAWMENDWSDIAGDDMESMCVKHGLCERHPATADDCKADWAQEFGVEPGDPINKWHPDARALTEKN